MEGCWWLVALVAEALTWHVPVASLCCCKQSHYKVDLALTGTGAFSRTLARVLARSFVVAVQKVCMCSNRMLTGGINQAHSGQLTDSQIAYLCRTKYRKQAGQLQLAGLCVSACRLMMLHPPNNNVVNTTLQIVQS